MNPLRQWRKRQHLRTLDIALRLAVTERTVSAWENGAFKPSSEAFGKIAEIMNESVPELRTAWFNWLMEMKNDPSVWRDPSTPLPPTVGLRESV